MIRPEDPLAPPSAMKRIAGKVAMSDVGMRTAGWYLKNVVPRIEPSLSEWTRGRMTSLPITPIVFLERPDRKAVPLTYFTDAGDVILIASNFRRRDHPTWYRDLKARPEVTLRARGRGARYLARETAGEERDWLWALATRWMPPLARYQEMAGARTIPIIRCTALEEAR